MKKFSILLILVLFLFPELALAVDAPRAFQAKTWVIKGGDHFDRQEYDAAIQAFNKALELNPEDANAYNNRGRAYEAKGLYDQAIEDYTRAMAINTKYTDAFNNRRAVYAKKGQSDKAVEDYTRAIVINPRHADAYNNRGIAYE
jgi:tetratricopeptide (TPR) repeat protein